MKRKPYRFFLYVLLECACALVLLLPFKCAVRLGALAGILAYRSLKKYRERTRAHVRDILCDTGQRRGAPDRDADDIARGVFINLGMTAAECLGTRKLRQGDIARLVKERDLFSLRAAYKAGKGVIVIGSHFGNWELSAIYGAQVLRYPVSVVARRIYYEPYNRVLVRIRESKGVKTLYRDDPAIMRACMGVLKRGEVLGIVPDQDVDSVDGIFVNFFGRKTYTPTGPAVLSLLSGAPLVPVFIVREQGRLFMVSDRPITTSRHRERRQAIAECTQQWSEVVERYIRHYPDLWVWMHQRWKTKPLDLSSA